MRKALFWRVFAAILLSAVGMMFACGCGNKSGISLGAEPATYAEQQQAWKSQMVDNMRAWLKSLDPQSAANLKETGKIVFPFEKLKAADPVHAQMVEDYADTLESRNKEEMAAQGLFVEFVPQEVAFKALGQNAGAYEFVLDFGGGHFTNLVLSEPL